MTRQRGLLLPLRTLLLLLGTSHAATDPVRTLLTHARVAPTWVTSVADTYALERRVDAVEAMEWQRDADLLCGRWELLATTQARGAGPAPSDAEGPDAGPRGRLPGHPTRK